MSAWMTNRILRFLTTALVCTALVLALPSLSNAAGLGAASTLRSTVAPAPANLAAFSAPSACAQRLDAPSNCAIALAHGLLLFTWACAGCDKTWLAMFVVNGQPSPPADIDLAPWGLAALSVRPNQFKTSDCVAIRIYNPANHAQSSTSQPLCLSSVIGFAAGSGAIKPIIVQSSALGPGAHPRTSIEASQSFKPNPYYVPPASGMGITHDLPTCTAHGGFGGGLACMAGLQAGMLALIWTCLSCDVDGYHLYRVDGGQHALLPSNGAYGHDKTVTLALLSSGDGFNGKCYAVTAYKGSNESALSNWVCAGAGSTTTTVTLSPAHALHWWHHRDSRTGTLGYTDDPHDAYDQTLDVGYADHYGENPFGDIYADDFHRSSVFFDVSSLAGHPIYKAILKLSALSSWHDYDNTAWDAVHNNLTAQSPEVCLTILDLATDRWWLNNDVNSSVGYLAPGGFMGPDFSIDVTSAVTNWTGQGASPNFGFILRGADENDRWHGSTNHVCLTQLQSISLVVTYF